jgi:multiple sugar transport system permease protein
MITDPDFFKVMQNTFVFAFGTIGLTIVLGLMFALVFQKNFTGGRIYQLIIFSPWITPTVAVALVWSWIYEPDRGFLNYVLGWFGIEPLKWLHSSETAMLGIIIFTVWKSIGWTMLFYLGALEKVSKGAYEAATIDGANWIKQFLHITLPLISPTTYFLFIINLISSIQVYDQIQIMTQGGPGGSTTTLLYMYYQKAFQNFQMGPANAVAMIILVIIMLLSLLSSFLSRRYVHYE